MFSGFAVKIHDNWKSSDQIKDYNEFKKNSFSSFFLLARGK